MTSRLPDLPRRPLSFVRAMALALLAAATSAGSDDKSVKDEASNFEIAIPPEKAGDWDKMAIGQDRKDIKAHFRTEFTDTEPLASFEFVTALFWICVVPTLLAGSRVAAYVVPPRAMNRATSATIMDGEGRDFRRCTMPP